MRSFNALLTLATLLSSTLVLATPTPTKRVPYLTIDGDDSAASSVRTFEPGANKRDPEFGLTNAERLARGLKLLPPKRRHGKAALARRSPGAPVTKRGVIMVTNANTNDVLGYVAENTGNNNHLGTGDLALAITFQFTVDSTLTTTSYAASWPLMGGIVGVVNVSDDLGTGSSNFCYIQGTIETPANSPPASVSNLNSYPSAEDSESAIWTYNSATNAITAQWVNTDSSLHPTSFEFISGSNALVMTGDSSTFERAFATSQTVHEKRGE
ncbi:hypothetical protein B0H19DRAFT_1057910 [Mycena capillaripes]|nr:hypothetical protein B0H19DRAFT_1057910 [Mycena capillaripes]